MLINKSLVAVIAVTLLLSACKKEPDPRPDGTTPGTLTADAGANQTALVGATVTLDGSASKDSESKPFTYNWTFTRKPMSSTATLNSATIAKPDFVPDQPGEYEVELTISNSANSSKDKVLVVATPRQSVLLDEQITAKTVLEDRIQDPALPDYIVDKRLIVRAELTIRPGVIIAFARDAQFQVSSDGGILIANGEATRKIKFVGKEAIKGFWQGLWLTSESSGNVLDQVEIVHGGSHEIGTSKAGLALSGKARLSLKNTLISQSDGYGLRADDGTVLREFASNTFSNNTESGAYVSADNVKMLDEASVFTSNNGRNVVEILKSNLSASTTETIWKGFSDKTPYRLLNSMTIQTGLRLLPGVSLQMARDVTVLVDSKGYLTATGTVDNRIKLTGVEAEAGFWRGVLFSYSSASKNRLDYVDISGGGSQQLVSGKKANIAISGAGSTLSVKNCTISQSAGYGIFVTYDARNSLNTDVATANKFETNVQGTILVEK